MMADILYKATKYKSVDDAMITQRGELKKKERQDNPHQDRERNSTRTND